MGVHGLREKCAEETPKTKRQAPGKARTESSGQGQGKAKLCRARLSSEPDHALSGFSRPPFPPFSPVKPPFALFVWSSPARGDEHPNIAAAAVPALNSSIASGRKPDPQLESVHEPSPSLSLSLSPCLL